MTGTSRHNIFVVLARQENVFLPNSPIEQEMAVSGMEKTQTLVDGSQLLISTLEQTAANVVLAAMKQLTVLILKVTSAHGILETNLLVVCMTLHISKLIGIAALADFEAVSIRAAAILEVMDATGMMKTLQHVDTGTLTASWLSVTAAAVLDKE